jgi:predicted dehydrogenase
VSSILGVALLGYGYAGRTFHSPLIAGVPGLRLVAVGSSSAEKVHADWPEVFVSAVPDEVLARPGTDLVVIATPNDTHFDLARRALLASKHVVVDKPFTVTVTEAKELAALAAREGRVLSVFHNRRWDADFLTVRSLIASGALGEVVHFESHLDRFRPEVRARWREQAGAGSGLWYDLGPHLLDQALQLFGSPDGLYADLARQRGGAEATDYFHVLLRYDRLRVILHGSMLVAGGSPRFVVHGTAASYVKSGLDPQEDALKRGEPPGGQTWGRDERDGALISSTQEGARSEAVATLAGDYRAYYEGVRDAILVGGANPVPASEAIAVMRLLELANESAASGRELPVTSD